MLAQATGLALLAALYPAALVVIAIYLGTERPRPIGLMFVAGAMAASAVMALAVYAVLKSGHLDLPKAHHTRYGLRLGLGLLMIAVSLILARRKPKPRKSRGANGAAQKSRFGGVTARLLTNPGRIAAFLMGFVLFFFSLTFIAAIQVIATARAGTTLTVLAFVLVIVLYASSAWLPYLFYLANPERTTRRLRTLNDWLSAHGRSLYVGGLGIAGLVVALDGVLGLTGTV